MLKQNAVNQGFTLIELLVVVLIVGVLAAVALPQYQLAIDKYRVSNLMNMAKAIQQAERLFYLENGRYTTSFTELNLGELADWDGNDNTKTNGNSRFQLNGTYLLASTRPDLYISYKLFYDSEKRSCYAYGNRERAKRLCKALTNRTTGRNGGCSSVSGGCLIYDF